jgi:ferredoxin-type protein NapH
MRKKRQKLRKGIILVSFFLFPALFFYLSPELILEASSRGIINGSFILFVLMFLSSLLLGRGYCGWLCPGAGCQEAMFLARDRRVTKGDIVKWLIWLPWIAAIAFLAWKAGGYRQVDFFYRTSHGLSVVDFKSLIVYFLVLFLLIVLPGLLVGRRSFCHHLCWMAPFMIFGRKLRNTFGWAALGLMAEPEYCSGCHLCTSRCPMSLEVEAMAKSGRMEHPECILCGTCVDTCKKGAITFCWARPDAGTYSTGE